MAGPRDPNRPGDVVVTVTASEVKDADGRTVAQTTPSTAAGETKRHVGQLRKERIELARRYQQLRGDLGGLLIEMARHDRFNHHLLRLKANEAVEVERRAREIDGALSVVATSARQGLPPGTVALTGVPCRTCSGVLPADANFCAYCGTPTH